MPSYVKIKPQESNLSGITSKGYYIYRRLHKVNIKWGAINVKNRSFFWAGDNLPQKKVVEFKTTQEAKDFYNEKINKLNRKDYDKLKIGMKILDFK